MATEDGGPTDIINNCHNGYLIDPLDKKAMADTLLAVLDDKDKWKSLAHNGIKGVREHYSWHAHAEKYLKIVKPVVDKSEPLTRMELRRRPMLYHDRALFTDLDQNLLGNPDSLREFVRVIQRHMANKQNYPSEPAARGMPYDGISNLRPESKAAVQVFLVKNKVLLEAANN